MTLERLRAGLADRYPLKLAMKDRRFHREDAKSAKEARGHLRVLRAFAVRYGDAMTPTGKEIEL